MKTTMLIPLLILTVLALAGCSDLQKDKVGGTSLESSRFDAGCELQVSEFENILKKDISPHIDCLGRNLDLFLRAVKSDRPGYLSRKAFEAYVVNYIPEFKPENVRAIKSVFDVSYLFFGGDSEYISPADVRKIIDFVFLFNREVIKVQPFFVSDEDGTPYNLHELQRARIFSAANSICSALLTIFGDDQSGRIRTLNIINLLESFSTSSTEETLEKVRAVLFVKKLFLGGDRNEITSLQLKDLLYKLVPLSTMLFDLARIKHLDLDDQPMLLKMVSGDLEIVEKHLYYPADSQEKLFSLKDLLEAMSSFFTTDEIPDLRPYEAQVLQVKMALTSDEHWSENENLTNKDWVLPGELKTILEHAKDVVARSTAYHGFYEFFRPTLASTAPVSINWQNYTQYFPTQEKYLEEFARITRDYRYFRGKEISPLYDSTYKRNPEGIVEIGWLEYGITLFMRRYGSPNKDKLGGYTMDVDQMQNLFKVFQPFLEGENYILKDRYKKTNENLVLLTTLFQNQSDGDGDMSVNELSEFGVTLLVTLSGSQWYMDEMAKVCAVDDENRVTDLPCYRKNFFRLHCEKYRKFYPRLFDALGMKTCDQENPANREWNSDFLITLENLARTCTVFKDGTDVPMSKDDYFPITVMLMNIEGTVIRHDTNKNNQMDPSEVRAAYGVAFKSAVQALVAKRASVIAKLPFNLGDTISQRIYYYLIKYKTTPEKWNEYLRLVTIGATTAKRDTIAAVLRKISDEGEPSTFDCETLRH